MGKKVRGYLWGLLLSCFAVIFFAAIGKITVGGDFGEANRFITPAIIAFIVWTVIFCFSKLFIFLLMLGAGFFGIGILLAIPVWAYVGFYFADYILPADWLVLSATEWFDFFGMGFVFMIIDFCVDRSSFQATVKKNS